MRGVKNVEEVFAVIAHDPVDDTEGIVGVNNVPLVVVSRDLLGKLRAKAKEFARQMRLPVRIIRFAEAEVVEEFKPQGFMLPAEAALGPPPSRKARQAMAADVLRSALVAARESAQVGFQEFDEPVMTKDVVVADRVVVAATLHDAKPAVAILYILPNGDTSPPFVVAGAAAEDLEPLCHDALALAKKRLHGGN